MIIGKNLDAGCDNTFCGGDCVVCEEIFRCYSMEKCSGDCNSCPAFLRDAVESAVGELEKVEIFAPLSLEYFQAQGFRIGFF